LNQSIAFEAISGSCGTCSLAGSCLQLRIMGIMSPENALQGHLSEKASFAHHVLKLRRAADKNVPITTRRVSEGTQCITGWSLAHASGWYIPIRRSPKRVAHGQFPDVAAKLTAWQVRSYEYAEDRYTSSRVLLRSIRSTCPIAETGGGYDAAQSS